MESCRVSFGRVDTTDQSNDFGKSPRDLAETDRALEPHTLPRHSLFSIKKERWVTTRATHDLSIDLGIYTQVLISRLYRTDFKYDFFCFLKMFVAQTTRFRRSIADVFRIQVVSNSDVRSPIVTLGSTSFFHVRINNLYVVAVTK